MEEVSFAVRTAQISEKLRFTLPNRIPEQKHNDKKTAFLVHGKLLILIYILVMYVIIEWKKVQFRVFGLFISEKMSYYGN